jgi:hypothetical protein
LKTISLPILEKGKQHMLVLKLHPYGHLSSKDYALSSIGASVLKPDQSGINFFLRFLGIPLAIRMVKKPVTQQDYCALPQSEVFALNLCQNKFLTHETSNSLRC